jgi:hypothetical protein
MWTDGSLTRRSGGRALRHDPRADSGGTRISRIARRQAVTPSAQSWKTLIMRYDRATPSGPDPQTVGQFGNEEEGQWTL